jgi:hypothetical protein
MVRHIVSHHLRKALSAIMKYQNLSLPSLQSNQTRASEQVKISEHTYL